MAGIGVYLEVARSMTGMTVRDAAERLGVNSSTLWKWEHDRGHPPLQVLIKMTEVYGRPLGQLSGLELLPRDVENVELPPALLEFISQAAALRLRLSEVVLLAAGQRSKEAQEEQKMRGKQYTAYEYLAVLMRIREVEHRSAVTGEPFAAQGMSSDAGVGGASAGVDRKGGEEVVAEEG